MSFTPDEIAAIRAQFPALSRDDFDFDGPPVYLDGPAGTQVPEAVIDAVSNYYRRNNANHEGVFATSVDSDAMLAEAHRASADLVGSDDPETVFFGQNMTSLTFALSRSLSREWKPGDQILVTRLDHDANVTPWVLAAEDAGATVVFAEVNRDDTSLDLEDFRSKLTVRTRLVAAGAASNSTGTVNPVTEISRWAHEVGALVFVDAVHFAPHALMDVQAFGCDFLACSAYKFFGPHVGIMWGKRDLLEKLFAYKVRPAPDSLPGRWMTGTQNHEGIAGVLAAIDYLAGLAGSSGSRREQLAQSFGRIRQYETTLVNRLLDGLAQIDEVNVWGITDPARSAERLPTVSITHAHLDPEELARRLAATGIFVWHGNYYALQISEVLGREPEGMVRIGLAHYNTAEEVDRLLGVVDRGFD